MSAAEPHPIGDFVTNVIPVVDKEGDAHFGPIVVRVLNYQSPEGENRKVILIGANEPGEYRVVFEGEISDVTKSKPDGEMVEGYLHYSGEWPS